MAIVEKSTQSFETNTATSSYSCYVKNEEEATGLGQATRKKWTNQQWEKVR